MANAYIIIGDGKDSWSTREDPNNAGEYIQYAPSSYQICVGVNHIGGEYTGPYWDYYNEHGWYQGSWFVRSPLLHSMLRDDFIALMTKVNNTIKSKYPADREHCPVFKRVTYSLAYVEVEKCFQEIIALLKSETGSEDWTYDEGECGPSIKYMFNCADKFVENWDTWNKKRLMKQKQKKYREAQKAKKLYDKLLKNAISSAEAMEMIKT